MDASSSSSSKCDTINEAILPPPPPPFPWPTPSPLPFPRRLPPYPPPPPPVPAACLNKEEWKIYDLLVISSSAAAAADCQEFRDNGDADDEMELVKAAMNGNIKIFDEPKLRLEHYLGIKCAEENNILHIAIRYEQKRFVAALLSKERYLEMNKKLISERNSHGNTPLHVAAQVGDKHSLQLMYGLYKYMINNNNKKKNKKDEDEKRPWRAQSSQGNTALHLALLSRNFEAAKFLVERDGAFLARMVNNSQEAPLHLAITHLCDDDDECTYMTEVLLKRARYVATWRDAKGLTPLLRAASLLDDSYVIVEVTKMIIKYSPDSTLVCDPSGKSFLHLLLQNNKIFDPNLRSKNLDMQYNPNYIYIEDLICLNEISILKNHQDQDGNTPLHIALESDNIHMANYLTSKCSVDLSITNKDGISPFSKIQQLNLWHLLRSIRKSRAMTEEEIGSAIKGDINFLLKSQSNTGMEFYGSRDSIGRNFLHLLLMKKPSKNYVSSSDDCHKLYGFIQKALFFFPKLLCQTDQMKKTPLHNLAHNKDLCKNLGHQKLQSIFAFVVNNSKREADNHDQLPWVMQDSNGNTPLHEAIIANNKLLVLKFLSYCKESLAGIVNKHKRTPLHLLAATTNDTMEFTAEEMMEIVNANTEALGLVDKDGLTPISTVIKAKNQQMVVAILRIVQLDYSNNDGQNSWHLILNHPSKNFVSGLLQSEAFRDLLRQKDKNNGYTPLHLAIKEKCFGFVENILETWGREQLLGGEEPESDQWLMDLLKIRDKDGLTPIIRALNADNPNLATRLCLINPDAAKIGDNNGMTIWHLLSKPASHNSVNVKELLRSEALRKVLEQRDNNGNTPLHLAMQEKCFCFIQDLLETWGCEERNKLQDNQWLMDLLVILDNDGLTPIIKAFNVNNSNLATSLCHVNPKAAKMGDNNGKTIWHLLSEPPSYKSGNVKELLESEALRKVLITQKDKDGNTALHLAIKQKCFGFVQDLLEASGSEHELIPWPLDLLRTPNNVGETPEDLLADLSILPAKLEKRLLTDRRMRGIRSSWRIPRAQLQNYMSSMNVIAALQTTITFTAAFTVPGGLKQDIGTPILIGRRSFQVFMISDVIAMCLSMMVLICLLWMVATDKRKSVMLQDFALTLLLLSFVATILTFMAGVYATIYPVEPWMAITTLVLCSLLMLFLPRLVLTNALLYFKYAKDRFVKMFSWPADSSNTQGRRSADSGV